MWTMGYNDGGEFNMASDSFNGRKLRPLIPRTPGLPNSTYNSSNSSPPRLNRLHGTDFFSLNHHLATMADQGKKDYHSQPVVVSSRWNPTPEQLRTLEELYRRGTRTPSAEQIQHITAQLRRYGKIEGKNVFYWFQNHKARERQKRRRQMESTVISDHEQQQIERKESEANRTAYEGEQTKNWVPSTNCSILPEESISIQRAKAAVTTECRTAVTGSDGWIQFDEVEFQHRRNVMERNATWQMMQLSCPSPIINTTTTINKPNCSTTLNAPRTTTKLIKTTHDLNIFIAPAAYNYNRENGQNELIYNNTINEEDSNNNGESHSQTLQLFPLRSDNGGSNDSINGNEETGTTTVAATAAVTPMNANFTTPAYQFFEFLPLKN